MFDRFVHAAPTVRAMAMGSALLLAATLAACSRSAEAPPRLPAQTPTQTAAPTQGAPGAPSAGTAPTREPDNPPAAPKDPGCGGEECIEVAVSGDILLHPALWQQARKDGAGEYDFGPLLAGIAPYLAQADLALCNLETPVGAPEGPFSGYPMFNVPPQIIPALKEVGYDGCTTASNHSMDSGVTGIVRTLDALDAAGMVSTGSYRSKAGAGKPLLIEAGSATVAVVAGTYSLNGMKEDAPWRVDDIGKASLIARAKAARAAGAEIVLAAIHDGAEYTSTPTPTQLSLYRALADSGEFDFIYSHHTHSVLPLEKRNGTWIAYGLGNSVAKHATKTVLNKEGLTVKMQFVRTGNTWKPGELEWAPHIMNPAPLRWCALPAAVQDPCTTADGDAASLRRTSGTVNAMGAKESGARMWKPAGN